MSSWLPSLKALRALEATARLGGYKRASEELHVTPAAVKQLVAKLEDDIGTRLLRRQGRRMVLTSTGVRGIGDLSAGFRQIAHAVERFRAPGRESRLVVSVDPSFAAAWLVPRLEDFRASHPDIDVLIESSMQIADLEGKAADVGIRFGVTDHGGLVARRLFDEELSALCSPALAKGPPEIARIEDLGNVNLLRWDLSWFRWAENTRTWNFWRTWLDAVGAGHVTPGPGTGFNDYNLAVQSAIAGHGFVLGSRPVLKRLLDTGLLVDPFSLSASPGIGYDVVTTREALSRNDVRRFVDWILRLARLRGSQPSAASRDSRVSTAFS